MLRQVLVVGLIFSSVSAAAHSVGSGSPSKGRCTLYEMRNLGGAFYKMRGGGHLTMASRDIGDNVWTEYPEWNDDVSSIHLNAGCRIQVWEHVEAQGASRSWQAKPDRGLSVNFVGSDWNDRISSAICTCR